MTNLENQKNNYQRLEFLGDRVLNLIVAHHLYKKFPDSSEGELTNKLRFTSNYNLEEIIDNLEDEFKKELVEFKSAFKTEINDLIADDVEAFIGNYYLQHGSEKTIEYFENFFRKEINAFDPNTDYISMFQIHTQKLLKIVPDYILLSEEPAENNQHVFYFNVLVGKDVAGEGKGKNKSEAKKQAALDALKKYGLIS